VHVHLAPRYSRVAIALVVLLTLLAIAAWMDHDPEAMLLFGAVGLVIAGRTAHAAGTAMATAAHVIGGSTEGELVVSGRVRERRPVQRTT
jgi:diadenosine tetraphosphate (Ap4A) HIT family hydrolase